jgi:hypothetical protein
MFAPGAIPNVRSALVAAIMSRRISWAVFLHNFAFDYVEVGDGVAFAFQPEKDLLVYCAV